MKFFKKYKSELILASGAVLAGVLSFFITIAVYPEIKDNGETNNQAQNQIANANQNESEKENQIVWIEEPTITNDEIINNAVQNDVDNEILVSEIGETLTSENEEMIAMENTEIHEVIEVINQEENINEEQFVKLEETEVTLPENLKEDLKNLEETIQAISQNTTSFDYPISGDIILEFAKDKLVYSETLKEWITHDGIDIKGEAASPVKAADDGIIESVKMDPRYGNTIIINHNDLYKTVYSNLSTLELVYVGKQVKKGDIISGVGEGFGFESEEGPHVHFEIIKDGECKNPVNG